MEKLANEERSGAADFKLIFSVVMIASFVQVFIEAFQRAIDPADKAPFDLSLVGAM